MPNENYSDTSTSCSRNLNIPFNYVWDRSNSYWKPMSLGALGSYADNIIAGADDRILKFGSNPNVSSNVSVSSPETIWDGSTEYVFPPDAGTGIQVKSDDSGDSQEIIIQGLDENFESVSWTGNLNGLSAVDVDGSWSRVFRAFNNDSFDFAGDINIHASGDDSTSYAKIIDVNNQTLMCVYTVPANTTGYLIQYEASAQNTQSSSSIGYTLHLKTREHGKVFRVKEVSSITSENSHSQSLPIPIYLSPKTDVIVNVVNANGNNGSINAEFSIALHS
jgi:hypothetical protein